MLLRQMISQLLEIRTRRHLDPPGSEAGDYTWAELIKRVCRGCPGMPSLSGTHANLGGDSSIGRHSKNSGVSRRPISGATAGACRHRLQSPIGLVLKFQRRTLGIRVSRYAQILLCIPFAKPWLKS